MKKVIKNMLGIITILIIISSLTLSLTTGNELATTVFLVSIIVVRIIMLIMNYFN